MPVRSRRPAHLSPAYALSLLLSVVVLSGCQAPPQPTRTASTPADSVPSDRRERESHSERRERENLRDRDEQPRPYEDRDREDRADRAQDRNHRGRGSDDQDPHFDYYLLNLSWSPEFCFTHPDRAECAQHRAFTLHGLWPQRLDGSYPEHCSDQPGPTDPGQFHDLYPDSSLLEHEWTTHGTCSGLDAATFFNSARSAVAHLRVPDQLTHLDHQVSMTPDDILSLFTKSNPDLPRSSLALSCGNNFLTAVELCLDKQLRPMSCGPIRSCRANSVRIPPPQS